MSADVLERWLEDVVSTPGLTALRSVEEARRMLLDDAVRAAPLIEANPDAIVDVGSGGGSPGIPLAVALPARHVTLLESQRRKCDFLEDYASALPNIGVVWGRAEEHETEVFGVALAKALAKPSVAAELCLPLVQEGGAAILWTGKSFDEGPLARVAKQVGGMLESSHDGLLVLRKIEPTPPGFPRRAGMAKKRPLV